MTKLLTYFSTENSKTRALPAISPGSAIPSRQEGYSAHTPLTMTYRDVVSQSGMSWSNMLKETGQVDFRQLGSDGNKRGGFHRRNSSVDRHHPSSHVLYHWIRTEDLENKQLATDRPYRNTYGDRKNEPSKLHISTELPNIDLSEKILAVEGVGQFADSSHTQRWRPNKQIARIYNLLHSGDTKQLSRLHVFTKKGNNRKALPIILPHFHIKLSKSINQVLREDEIQSEVVYTRRPMTSEKITYRPITEKHANPELIISKTGKVEFRPKKSSANHITPRMPATMADVATRPEPPPEPKSNSQTNKKLETNKGRLVARSLPLTPRNQAKKVLTGADDLNAAEGFPLSVKITPKLHPANEKATS